jgi:hypothetical protein
MDEQPVTAIHYNFFNADRLNKKGYRASYNGAVLP